LADARCRDEETQELDLQQEAHLAELVEEELASVGGLDLAVALIGSENRLGWIVPGGGGFHHKPPHVPRPPGQARGQGEGVSVVTTVTVFALVIVT
jgi:hypothetical protein